MLSSDEFHDRKLFVAARRKSDMSALSRNDFIACLGWNDQRLAKAGSRADHKPRRGGDWRSPFHFDESVIVKVGDAGGKRIEIIDEEKIISG